MRACVRACGRVCVQDCMRAYRIPYTWQDCVRECVRVQVRSCVCLRLGLHPCVRACVCTCRIISVRIGLRKPDTIAFVHASVHTRMHSWVRACVPAKCMRVCCGVSWHVLACVRGRRASWNVQLVHVLHVYGCVVAVVCEVCCGAHAGSICLLVRWYGRACACVGAHVCARMPVHMHAHGCLISIINQQRNVPISCLNVYRTSARNGIVYWHFELHSRWMRM